jgi:hypothetical protein
VTSPPYWALRSYLDADDPAKVHELGCEPTPQEYVSNLVAVFREVRRVLRDDGSAWLNLGSSYSPAKIESEEHVLRDDLTETELAYVYAELASHFASESEAVSQVRRANAPTEYSVPGMLEGEPSPPGELPAEDV